MIIDNHNHYWVLFLSLCLYLMIAFTLILEATATYQLANLQDFGIALLAHLLHPLPPCPLTLETIQEQDNTCN